MATEFVGGLVGGRHDDGARLRLALRAARSTLLFEEVDRVGLRVTSGLVVSDRSLPEPLLTTPERTYDEARGARRAAGTAAAARGMP